MSVQAALNNVKQRMADIDALGSALALLGWDLQTIMPAGAGENRAVVSATLCRMAHEQFVDTQMGDWLHTLTEAPLDNPEDAAMVRVLNRAYQREVKVPTRLVEALEMASSRALPVWAKARQTSQFNDFAPLLAEIVQLNREKADALKTPGAHPYDALLDAFEPDMTVAQLDPLFDQLEAALTPLLQQIQQGKKPADTLPVGRYPKARQLAYSQTVLTAMGFDSNHGRLDESVHPFTCGLTPTDVRLTTRIDEADPFSCLFSVLHEGGHGLYMQGHAPSLWQKGMFDGASLGIHESQSRLWENLVGRSHAFWQATYPQFQQAFAPVLDDISLDSCFAAVNRVQPSAIRVEADEVTYNLHIILRYQLEKALLTGDLSVNDLPDAWNEGMTRLLGYTPKNHAEGCLQDVHWAHGTIGYFPTYTLGNLYASMFWQQAEKAGVTQGIAQGQLHPLRDWLKDNIHFSGASETPNQLCQRVTGKSLDAKPFLDYLRQKYNAKVTA